MIIESASLSSEELERASHLAMMADADFIKTSTGFSATGGATGMVIHTYLGSVVMCSDVCSHIYVD